MIRDVVVSNYVSVTIGCIVSKKHIKAASNQSQVNPPACRVCKEWPGHHFFLHRESGKFPSVACVGLYTRGGVFRVSDLQWEVAGSNLALRTSLAPRSTQPSITPWSANEYQHGNGYPGTRFDARY